MLYMKEKFLIFFLKGRIPILVIDNINALATCSPTYLNMLQKQAKSWADKSILTVVFVVSDGAAPPLMESMYNTFSMVTFFC